ncbi:MAG: copper chaperone PCu(A)C [Proteobacteria bacterium]|nr:copper chaperone PCu(A)C [Pseudomonadota bacterium]
MTRRVAWLVVLVLLAIGVDAQACEIDVVDAWIRPAPPGTRVRAAYVTLRNAGVETCHVTGVTSESFRSVSLHRTVIVDGVARIVSREPEGESVRLAFAVPDALSGFIAAKGSVTLDGVSLTVNRVEDSRFEVNLVPHTLRCTAFGAARPDDRVNLEIDVLARYIARINE